MTVSISKENGACNTAKFSKFDASCTYTTLLLFFALNAHVGARASSRRRANPLKSQSEHGHARYPGGFGGRGDGRGLNLFKGESLSTMR